MMSKIFEHLVELAIYSILYNIIQHGYMSHIQSIFPLTRSHSIGVSPIFQQTHWTPAMAFVPGQGRLPLIRGVSLGDAGMRCGKFIGTLHGDITSNLPSGKLT